MSEKPEHEVAGPSGTTTEAESNEVVYKIRKWSLPGAAVMPVLNVSSRVTWLELDDKALLESYAVLQEGILWDVFSQKCSGLTSCCRKGTYGPPLLPRGPPQR